MPASLHYALHQHLISCTPTTTSYAAQRCALARGRRARLQDLEAVVGGRAAHVDGAVKTPRPQQRLVKQLYAVGRAHHLPTTFQMGFKALVELLSKLKDVHERLPPIILSQYTFYLIQRLSKRPSSKAVWIDLWNYLNKYSDRKVKSSTHRSTPFLL